MYHFYKKENAENIEYCFNVETKEPLGSEEIKILKQLLVENFFEEIKDKSHFNKSEEVIELGPCLNFTTAFSTNSVDICHACGLTKITRIEKSRRCVLSSNTNKTKFIEQNHDRMTETQYLKKLTNFKSNIKTEPVINIPLIKKGISTLKDINKKMGLSMDDWDEKFYYDLFVNKIKRDPTNVECFQLGQANSEHSRHWFFKGKIIIDKKMMSETLLEIIFSTLKNNPNNSLIAFKDNSSAIKGFEIDTIIPKNFDKASAFKKEKLTYHITFTAETHNFPTGVAPLPGAETGTGGRIRDMEATGRGSLVGAGTAGYCVGNLNIPNYNLSWEDKSFIYPSSLATPLEIIIKASNGASDYGNKFGEPLIQGYTRSFGLILPNKERQEWIKPIMFTGGVGQINDIHIKKRKPSKGMFIIQIGGPAYRIGVSGGAASSMIQGENIAELDFNAVQRGDAEMEQKMNRVIRACVEMGKNNPIISIHDQGAGGPCNVLTELVDPIGGKIEIRDIKVGDETMSVFEIWGAEYQERNALLIMPKNFEKFKKICIREKCSYEILGEITDDGKIVVHDNKDNSTPVDLELEKILGKMPQKTFTDKNIPLPLEPLKLPDNLTIKQALEKVLCLLSVGSKRFLTSKVDRSVTGLIAQQQCVGPLQLTVSDVAVIAQSHFSQSGAAISIGEQPIKIMINPEAGARMTVGEALTNIVWAKISNLKDIKCSGNWMWAAKLPGEAAKMYKVATATREMMIQLGIAIDGGKDSLSMATKVGGQIVKSPGELTISAYAPVPNINKIITPDIKDAGKSNLWIIDLGNNKNRMGGSALAQTLKQVGNESPDIENYILKKAFNAVQEMIDKKIILSGHDRSDGGLITTLLEMAFAGNVGLEINQKNLKIDPINYYFNEELGLIVEVNTQNDKKFLNIIKKHKLLEITSKLGKTTKKQIIKIKNNRKVLLQEDMRDLRALWEKTSFELKKLQTNTDMAKEEKKNIYAQKEPKYHLTFSPTPTTQKILQKENKPKIAILREEGSNGDREMASAFYQAGFEVWDVTMKDLLQEKISLDNFRGIAFVGGFSYADVLGSAKGWASTIKFNKKLKIMFDNFYKRQDTFSLGVCNGCQLMAHLGWIPWQKLNDKEQPKFIKNKSEKFESRWTTVKIMLSPSIMLRGMENSVLGAWVAHGEGNLSFPNNNILKRVKEKKLAPLVYIDDNGKTTEKYPFNPNGSIKGISGLCSLDGRHLAIMPHPERTFLKWQWPWMPKDWQKNLKTSPWLQMFQNAQKWCEENQ
ncbi:MAG: phosphoribosylformylglycinamidine synthase [Patescibacteria group bacterium]